MITLQGFLSLRPCPEMSTYDFLYRIAVDLVYTSNSFSVIFWNKDFTRVESIQPITTTSYRIFEDDKNNILFRFRWDYDGKTYTVPYQNVIHVKARYNKRRFLGTTPDMELKKKPGPHRNIRGNHKEHCKPFKFFSRVFEI